MISTTLEGIPWSSIPETAIPMMILIIRLTFFEGIREQSGKDRVWTRGKDLTENDEEFHNFYEVVSKSFPTESITK
jgi:hypothetical protein